MAAIISRAQSAGAAATAKSQAALDARWAPEQRTQFTNNIRSWSAEHPRLSLLLAANVALAGPPLLIFTLFAASVFFGALTTCLVTAVFLTLCFTGFCIGAALIILIPALLVATILATTLFVWGAVAYWILQRFAESETPMPHAERLYRKINAFGARAVQPRPVRGGSSVSNGTSVDEKQQYPFTAESIENKRRAIARNANGMQKADLDDLSKSHTVAIDGITN